MDTGQAKQAEVIFLKRIIRMCQHWPSTLLLAEKGEDNRRRQT